MQRFDSNGAYKSQFNVTTADGRSVSPRGLAIGPGGSIYVASIQADAILKFSSNGSLVHSLNASGRFQAPTSLDIGPDGLLYVVDADAGVVRVLDADDGSPLLDVGEPAQPGFFFRPGWLQVPDDVAVDGNGRIIVADTGHDRLQVFDHAGGFVMSAGAFGFCPHPDCLGHGIQFDQPFGVTAGPDGLVYVADTRNHRVVALEPRDAVAPSIVSVDATRVLTGTDASNVYVSATFDEPMRVYQRPGSAPPSVLIAVAGEPVEAAYAYGSGTETLVFRHASGQAGSGPADGYVTYASAEPFALNNGSITDLAGNRADLEVPSIDAKMDYAALTAGNEITVAYSGPAYASPLDYANLTLDPGGPRTVVSVAGNGDDRARRRIRRRAGGDRRDRRDGRGRAWGPSARILCRRIRRADRGRPRGVCNRRPHRGSLPGADPVAVRPGRGGGRHNCGRRHARRPRCRVPRGRRIRKGDGDKGLP